VGRNTIPLYLLSGALGLFTADHFLCSAFAKIGSARTLIIFSFSPLFVAAWSFLFWGETLPLQKLIAIVFFMACVFTLSLEKFKKEGHWEIPGLLMAVSGILLDALGNVITSYAFKTSPTDGVISVCALRAAGAFLLFLALSPFIKVRLIENFKKLPPKRKSIALGASVIGTFLSITLWVSAVKRGNLTTLAALAGINPLFAACFEIAMGKNKASSYLFTAFLFFGLGFYFLVIR
jgi:drug/metabolite transporter (DMT)-like permease